MSKRQYFKNYNKLYYKKNKKQLKERHRLYYQKNKKKIKKQVLKYAKSHKKQLLRWRRKHYKKNKVKMLRYFRKYRKNHREETNARNKKYSSKPEYKKKMKQLHKKYKQKNRLRIRKVKLKWVKLNYRIDPVFRLARLLRQRIHSVLKGDQKAGSAVRDLGCSVEFLKQYIEKKFYAHMTWKNWGRIWELDHIKPLSKFDLTDREEFLKACNYRNLQPLTIKDHRKKTLEDIKRTTG
jgi:hypothetical protein